MTKTLTEQWREGTLPEGYYYTKLNDDNGTIEINYCWDDGCFQDYCDNMVKEVLSLVPSYDEYRELLDLNVYEKDRKKVMGLEDKIKRLQEQLADASKTIDYYDKKDFHYTLADGTVMGAEPAHKYKIKWGVK